MNADSAFHRRITALGEGAYDVTFKERRFLLRKETLLGGRLIKLYARELGGNDLISLNYYPSLQGGLIKPCEMSETKVVTFVLGLKA
jgi:hypothetical protein